MRSHSLLARVGAITAAVVLLVLSLALASSPTPAPGELQLQAVTGSASGEVELHDIKYDQLVKKVKDLRGNIVVMDVWATYCRPCMREFPGLVQMSQKHARDGVVCLSITVDEKERRDDALKFLRAKKATLWNYYLEEDPSVWTKRWNVEAIPLVMVFDRTGQRAARFPIEKDRPFTYVDVEKVVQDLLAQPH